MSVAAAALAEVLAHDQAQLRRATDLTIAAQARDQVLDSLTQVHSHLFPGLVRKHLHVADLLRHPVQGLGQALRTHPRAGLMGPAPSDLALQPPTHPVAADWVKAAAAIDEAALRIWYATPDYTPAAQSRIPREVGQPLGPTDMSATAWALTADVAAMAAALASTSTPLARALLRSGDGNLVQAGGALAGPQTRDLDAAAVLTLRLAQAGPLPRSYDLQEGNTHAPVPVLTIADAAAGLDHALRLLEVAPPLTGPQQRGLATAVASTVHALARQTRGRTGMVLTDLATHSASHAALWAASPLGATSPGQWAAVEQVRTVGSMIRSTLDARTGQGRPPTTALHPADPVDLARRLPEILRQAAANLRQGLETGAFLVPDPTTKSGWAPVAERGQAHRWQTAATALADAAADTALALSGAAAGSPGREARPGASTLSPARALLGAATRGPTRPTHPVQEPARTAPRPPSR